jgi:hypothetical protein
MKRHGRLPALPVALLCCGAIAGALGLVFAPARTWPNLLLDGFYLMAVGVSATFFLATQRLTSARWSAALRRIPEAFMLVLPVAALLMIPLLLFGRQTLYPWSRPGGLDAAAAASGKGTYLHPPFVWARTAAVLVIWCLFAWRLRRASLDQDRRPAESLLQHRRMVRLAALFIPTFAFTISFAAYDWLGSLEPNWSSTMFAVYVFAGVFVLGLAAITLGVVILADARPLHGLIGERQLHDLGKLLFAFSTFWAYIWTCQYLLIWYADVPEEVTHYLTRTNGAWVYPFAANFVINWTVPFLALLSASAKQRRRRLAIVAVLVLGGRWLDLYVLIMPAFSPAPRFGLLEIALAAGTGALLTLLVRHNLAAAPLLPRHDPILAADAPSHLVALAAETPSRLAPLGRDPA